MLDGANVGTVAKRGRGLILCVVQATKQKKVDSWPAVEHLLGKGEEVGPNRRSRETKSICKRAYVLLRGLETRAQE